MRVALITFFPRKDDSLSSILKKLQGGSAERGNQVEVFNGHEDLSNTRLTMYDYIAVVMKPAGLFGGKIPPRIAEYLATSGTISGKKGCALVVKSGFASNKACQNLMRAMEAEGVKLDYFEVIRDADHAAWVGKKIG